MFVALTVATLCFLTACVLHMPHHTNDALRLKPKLLIMCWMMNYPYLYRFHFQLAGVVAVEVTGGPTVDFVPGRKVCYSGLFLQM